MTKTKAWIHAARLRTLPLSLSGIILGSFVAKSNGFWNISVFMLALLTTVLFQILSNLANDLGDSQKGADNEGRVGPQRAVQSGIISQEEMRKAVILFSILSFFAAGTLIYFASLDKSLSFWVFYAVLAVFCVSAAITYTVGKRAYGYQGLGDFFVFVFFGLVSVLGVYHLYLPSFEWASFRFENLLPAVMIGFFSTAVLNLNNMRDRSNDAKVGKRTLVVKLGAKRAKLYHAFLILGGISSFTIFVFEFHSENKWMVLALLPQIILIVHLRKAMRIVQERSFDPELKKVALSAFAISVMFALAIILQAAF